MTDLTPTGVSGMASPGEWEMREHAIDPHPDHRRSLEGLSTAQSAWVVRPSGRRLDRRHLSSKAVADAGEDGRG